MMRIEEVERLEYYADNIHCNWLGLNEAAKIDGPIAEQPCPKCKSKRGYRQIINSGSHRAFSVCFVCRDATEF